MKRVLIIGASGGIGASLSEALTLQHSEVVTLSRSVDGLDVTRESSVADHFDQLEGDFDGLFVATGALEIGGLRPEKALKQLSAEAMVAQFMTNTVGPALVLKHALPRLRRTERCFVGVLSARVGSIGDNGLGGWHSYRVSKAALNQIVRGTSIELARTHPEAICVALHPGTVATRFTEKYVGSHPTVAPAEAARNLLNVAQRLTPKDTGAFFDWRGKPIPW